MTQEEEADMASTTPRETLPRADAAARLRQFADEVEAGTVSGDGIEASVPDPLDLELEIEAGEIEIKLRWPPRGSSGA